nr:unnamed protein product [Spirometra erinaceieuropaei]
MFFNHAPQIGLFCCCVFSRTISTTMAQGKMKVKTVGAQLAKHKQSGGSVKKKNKHQLKKGARVIKSKSKAQNANLSSMKKNLEKMIKSKVESEVAGKVASTEPLPLKFIK